MNWNSKIAVGVALLGRAGKSSTRCAAKSRLPRGGLLLTVGAILGVTAMSRAADAAAKAPAPERFSFVAMGCMPYGKQNFAAYERLLAEINRHHPAFTVHCG